MYFKCSMKSTTKQQQRLFKQHSRVSSSSLERHKRSFSFFFFFFSIVSLFFFFVFFSQQKKRSTFDPKRIWSHFSHTTHHVAIVWVLKKTNSWTRVETRSSTPFDGASVLGGNSRPRATTTVLPRSWFARRWISTKRCKCCAIGVGGRGWKNSWT